MRHPVAVLVPTLALAAPARARRSCTSGSTPRTPRSCRPRCRRGPRSTGSTAEVRRGRVRADRPRGPDDGAGDRARPTWRRSTTTRAGSPRTRASRRVDSLVDVDPRLTLRPVHAALRRPERPARPVRPDRPRGDDPGRPDGVHALHAVRPEPRRGPGARRRPCATHGAATLAPPAGMTVLVGGGAADVADVVDRVRADFPRTALFIIVTTYLVLFVLLRSVVLPAKALVMNTLSIVASFGALVWIFQDGNLSALLGFQPLGFVETTQPVILFCVLFGLSMDYEVFLLSRMKEVWDRTGDNVEAVAGGMERSGRIVTSAALIVVVVAGSFAFADIVLIKALGDRDGDRGGARRDGRPRAARAGHDAPARPLELVDARPALERFVAGAPAGVRGRGGGGDPMTTRRNGTRLRRAPAWAALAVASSSPRARAAVAADPRQPDRRPRRRSPPPSRAADRRRRSRPRVLPRDDGPHDRLTEWWYYTGHLRAADGQPVRLRVRDLPRRARPLPDVVGLAPRGHRRDRRPLPVRPAADVGRRSTGRHSPPTATPTGFDLSLDPAGPVGRSDRPVGRPAPSDDWAGDVRAPRRAWAMAGSAGHDRLHARMRADGGRSCRVAGRARPRPGPRPRPSRPPCTTTTAGSTSGRPAARTTTRGRRWTRRAR